MTEQDKTPDIDDAQGHHWAPADSDEDDTQGHHWAPADSDEDDTQGHAKRT
jgi:hypothetical protein